MGTKDFNILDKLIARMRLDKVIGFVEKGDIVLDFGCGHQAYLLQSVGKAIKKGIGLDSDSKTHKIDEHIEVRNFRFTKNLPFGDKSFDKVFMLAVLEHLDPQQASLLFAEYHRTLKDGGKIILTTPTPWGRKILEFLAFRLGIISAQEVADHKVYYGKQDLYDFARKHHYTVEFYNTFQLGGNSLCVMKKQIR